MVSCRCKNIGFKQRKMWKGGGASRRTEPSPLDLPLHWASSCGYEGFSHGKRDRHEPMRFKEIKLDVCQLPGNPRESSIILDLCLSSLRQSEHEREVIEREFAFQGDYTFNQQELRVCLIGLVKIMNELTWSLRNWSPPKAARQGLMLPQAIAMANNEIKGPTLRKKKWVRIKM